MCAILQYIIYVLPRVDPNRFNIDFYFIVTWKLCI